MQLGAVEYRRRFEATPVEPQRKGNFQSSQIKTPNDHGIPHVETPGIDLFLQLKTTAAYEGGIYLPAFAARRKISNLALSKHTDELSLVHPPLPTHSCTRLSQLFARRLPYSSLDYGLGRQRASPYV